MNHASGFSTMVTLTVREIRRVFRQPTRLIAAVGTVAMLWIIFSAGLAGTFSRGDESYGTFLVPGMASMVVLFASVFGAISLIEDRQEGFLQGVLVSPAPRWSIIGGKIAGGSAIALAQGILVLLLAPLSGVDVGFGGLLLGILILAAVSIGITGVGLSLAWRINSVAGFHGVMNLVLLPMWLLGGTLFPIDSASPWLSLIMKINPLSWTIDALRQAMGGAGTMGWWAWVGCVLFAGGGALAAWLAARSKSKS